MLFPFDSWENWHLAWLSNLSTVPEVERNGVGMQTILPPSTIWAWTARTDAPTHPRQPHRLTRVRIWNRACLSHDGLGNWHIGEPEKAGEKQMVYLPQNSIAKNDPPGINHGEVGSPPMKPLIFIDDPTLDQLIEWGYCLADLMVSSPWTHVTG